jgi:endonuclease/exonuclease/phosphatase family metal-dependent hydrolase
MQFLKVPVRLAAPLLLALAVCVPGAASAQTLKVLDWNTHHGVGTDGEYSLQRFVTWIARSGAHVVSLNEVEKNNGWGNEDQPARYAALLRAATGKTWYYTFAQRDGGTNGQGNLILSTIPFEATGATTLSYSRSVARAQIVVNGVRVNIFSTHLDADSSSRRATQMEELKSWASRYSQQHIMAGDFNAWPGATEISNMTAVAYDAWAEAKSDGTALAYDGNTAGNTRNSRIDYVWYSKRATQLVLRGAQVFDTRDAAGVMPSDHRPVMATFQVAGGSSTTITPTGSRSDLVVFRPSTGEWLTRPSTGSYSAAASQTYRWGLPTDRPVAGDFDGDGRLDLVVYRPSDGGWYIRYSSTGYATNQWAYFQWGLATDIPIAADFDGDGRSDLGVYRPSDGGWYIRYSSTGYAMNRWAYFQWGLATDVPMAGDFDGDGRSDLAVYRPSDGGWYIRYSSVGFAMERASYFQWGLASDKPLSADFDGDGKSDLAVYRPSEGNWYILFSRSQYSLSNWTVYQWGLPTDVAVPADFDGDARTDLAVYRPSTGEWFIRYSSAAYSTTSPPYQWGAASDVPIVRVR